MIEPLLQAERLLLVGLLDQAEALYERTAAADPRNAMAVMGLARVAVARGDDSAAYGFASRALEIDPKNAAAVGLEARLRELLGAGAVSTGGPPAPTPIPPATPTRRGLLRRVLGR